MASRQNIFNRAINNPGNRTNEIPMIALAMNATRIVTNQRNFLAVFRVKIFAYLGMGGSCSTDVFPKITSVGIEKNYGYGCLCQWLREYRLGTSSQCGIFSH